MDDNDLSESAKKRAARTIHPIVEFFEIDADNKSENDFINVRQPDRKLLQKDLKSSKGIYAFYNSEMEVIYLGKTKNNLYNEMKNAFGREMEHYKRFKVSHPRSKYSPVNNEKVRPIRRSKFYIWEAAKYFSAYAISDDELIDLVELMMIRLFPNDLLNVRMEGNMTLKPLRVNERVDNG
ncbi:MAG: hypothetical protein AAGC58_02030 [Asticcacaulis sp.]